MIEVHEDADMSKVLRRMALQHYMSIYFKPITQEKLQQWFSSDSYTDVRGFRIIETNKELP